MVVIGRSLLIFSEVFKIWPYWDFWFPDSNFSLALNISSKLKSHKRTFRLDLLRVGNNNEVDLCENNYCKVVISYDCYS